MGWPKWSVTDIMTERPRVRVNQLGYLLGRPKQATLVSDAEQPVYFTVRNRDGVAVHTGLSRPWSVRPEPTSGLNVHVLDFTGLNSREPASGSRRPMQCSHPFEVTSRLYDMLAADALRLLLPDAVGDTDLGPASCRAMAGPQGMPGGRRIVATGGARVDRARSAAAVPGVAV